MTKEIKIKFVDVTGKIPKEYYPVPSKNILPEWYKKAVPYLDGKQKVFIKDVDGFSGVSSTIKKCIPVFDVTTLGYIIVSPSDLYVTYKDKIPYYSWPSDEKDLIGTHPNWQAQDNPKVEKYIKTKDAAVPKWMSPWGIITPKGYSCLFIPPAHRESVFEILEGVVDTDEYNNNINFPFVFTKPNFEGVVPAGTPIAQVIPFKRDTFKMAVAHQDSEEVNSSFRRLTSTFFNGYKSKFWQRKSYN